MKKFLTYAIHVTLYLTSASILALSPPAPPLRTIADRVNGSTDVVVGTPQRVVLIDIEDNVLDSSREVGLTYKRIALVVKVNDVLYSKNGHFPENILISFASIGKAEKGQVERYVGKSYAFVVTRYQTNRKGQVVESFDVRTDPIALNTPGWTELNAAVRNRLENESKSNETKNP